MYSETRQTMKFSRDCHILKPGSAANCSGFPGCLLSERQKHSNPLSEVCLYLEFIPFVRNPYYFTPKVQLSPELVP